MADAAVDGEDPPITTTKDDDDTSAAAIFASMVPPASVMGSIEAKIHMETSALDAFVVQLLEGLRKLASVSLHQIRTIRIMPHDAARCIR